MKLKILKPRNALNKAFLKVKPNRTEIEGFKTNLITLLDRTNDTESEEFHKNLVIDFLKKTYYDPNHFINTKGKNDLVIHNGNSAKSTVGVIVEAKKPTNKSEMISRENLNKKAFQELVLYYLRERITHKNLEIKQLVATNINEWFIFDATLFDRLFAQNKNFVKQFNDFEGGRLADTKTDFFYKQIAEPFIADIKTEIECAYFDLQEYQKPLRNTDKADDNKLIALFKLLSAEHLLKLPFSNDSNSLDKRFYSELLHIIGLTEIKEGSKKLIERNKEGERNSGSILEDAIIQLDSLDKISRLDKPSQFGNTPQERLFNVGLELSITWINRILFLKLLEAQLITYHKGDKSYSFLNLDKIKNYDDLNSLFFQVLARRYSDRNDDVKKAFEKVPYLNSSLFEPTEIEQVTLFISNLRDDKAIPVIASTILKNDQGKKRTGDLSTLAYLFDFLNAYDFSSEGSEEIQEDNKSLINASVLGLIFEKINGYKDGSFFTPGFITMYMCRETIRKAVIQKFNDIKKWNCHHIEELYNHIEDRKEANGIINRIKICDPAVGSGHFLVSALNEMIAVKSDLKILQDRTGKRLKEYQVEVVNDELIVTDEEGELFEYNPGSTSSLGTSESQRIQETLFHEKQTIIENCLFGVDINPNSVKICRLRLWIELLKNAYYIQGASPVLEEVSEERRGYAPFNNLPYLQTFRKELRNNLTPAEAKLWTLLKGKQMDGRKFRRQHSVANYILDFYCPEERLAIELDGQGHFEASQAAYDTERDLFLKEFGIRVLRFENKWVWDNPEGLLEEVKKYFGKQPPRPADTPPSKGGELQELQTLPNIDINIKCGNSLVSRFAIDADLKQALKKSKWSIDSYRMAVATYRNAESKEQKREMERLIADIKSDFRTEISLNDPKLKKLSKAKGDLFNLTNQPQLFELGKKEKADWNKKVGQLTTETKKLETEIEEIKGNKIFENAFEWRFEFPEVLNDEGDFVGFDVVIGNPPYGVNFNKENGKFYNSVYGTFNLRGESYTLFVERAITLLNKAGHFSFIIPDTILNLGFTEAIRKYVLKNAKINELTLLPSNVFVDATVDTILLFFQKEISKEEYNKSDVLVNSFDKKNIIQNLENPIRSFSINSKIWFETNSFNLQSNSNELEIISKMYKTFPLMESFTKIFSGVKAYEVGKGKPAQTPEVRDTKPFTSKERKSKVWLPFFDGRDIGYYSLLWKENNWIHYGVWLAAPRLPENFEGEKILIRKITGKTLIANYISYTSYCNTLLFVLKLKKDEAKISYKALLGILNSKFIGWYFRKKFQITDEDTFPQIMIRDIQQFAVPNVKNLLTDELELKVNEILANKEVDPSTDTTDLETQIDHLVYQLYELAEEEINIIENS
ncbi:MAG TPA: DUF559 domain-containing protein [Niabella sp.]|nr:DUF559 domain-containing protein [Niabella sp.]HOZ95452.1 DUF559 domain-containing protein [Niabella sp.]HQW14342.1 DUF559 domain-containing protein [Niabella sp.]HQX18379.1 DUF559 domain-containing protein [Niabella sp.]HQX40129.1 DUF559 domain-containing protein [Niabella sp.]